MAVYNVTSLMEAQTLNKDDKARMFTAQKEFVSKVKKNKILSKLSLNYPYKINPDIKGNIPILELVANPKKIDDKEIKKELNKLCDTVVIYPLEEPIEYMYRARDILFNKRIQYTIYLKK